MTSALTHPTLSEPHGFFTREGGVSEGIYQGLNCGPGSHDKADHVAENRSRVAAQFGQEAAKLCTLYQIHSAEVVTVTEPFDHDRPKADAMVTNRGGIVLGILTADCAPVLFADTNAGVIGAAHAGWKGAVSGVVENTVAAMEALGAARANIHAVIGPCIAQPSYEVSEAFFAPFTIPERARFFVPSTNPLHWMFDLEGYVLELLQRAGVKEAQAISRDTYREEDLFYSYRRTTHRGEPDYGRQISAIALK